MNEQILNVTLISRHDIEANWLQSDYVPEKGEIIVYDIESEGDLYPDDRYEPYAYERFKIGDGKTVVSDLPFSVDAFVETVLSKGTTVGTGNAVTDISVSGHQITLKKGATFIPSAEKGAANGVATLGSGGKVPSAQIPAATATTLGGVKLSLDGTVLTIKTT